MPGRAVDLATLQRALFCPTELGGGSVRRPRDNRRCRIRYRRPDRLAPAAAAGTASRPLLDQQVLDSEFPRCAEKGVGFVIGAVFGSGILATGAVQGARYAYAPAAPEMLAKVARIEAVCTRHSVPLAAAALQFPLGHPSVASVIPGGLSPEHVRQNVAAFHHTIPSALWAELKHEGLLRADAPTP
jgi:aryl-alcohol dehydrogenase-like predicted oxidoreductase